MERRDLSFSSYDDLLAEIARLRERGYEQRGQWSLGQICGHLSYYLRGSLEGFGFKLPWLLRKLVGRPLLRRRLRTGRIADGGRTIPASVPPTGVDEEAAAAEACHLLERLRDNREPLHPSPLFDRLTPDEWRIMHLMHAAHHLSFLVPRGP